ncbi:hypothetical protein QFC24_001842 [Naganishia onofrii]|uniref:Uncharacterized protein n=1 Tax=Naganishia onofrii TaxID=1851511 RepID=A0ACC2XTW5_9TREE|nr:hypothetical protein QFC24_001842 [Naganishia onofrii]
MKLLGQGTHSMVYECEPDEIPAAVTSKKTKLPRGVVCKVVAAAEAVLPPHDIRREIAILKKIDHPNVIPLLYDEGSAPDIVSDFKLYFPLIGTKLMDLMENPFFAPVFPSIGNTISLGSHPDFFTHTERAGVMTRAKAFEILATSIGYQLTSALAHLHSLKIAHRDVKPANILINEDGRVELIDLGTAFDGSLYVDDDGNIIDVRCQTNQVGSGPYRAPELLFGADSYSPMHIDLWALGATLSEFFTPMMFATMDSTIVVDLDSLQHHENARLPTYNFGKVETPESVSSEDEMRSEWSFKSMRKGAVWTRQTIFDGGRGEIGLAGSIFKLLGTPSEDDWRELADVPERYKEMYAPAQSVRLDRVLPFADIWDNEEGGITCTNNHIQQGDAPTPTISFLQGLLQLSPSKRTVIADCLDHPCFRNAVLPPSVYESKNVILRKDIGMDRRGLLRSWLASSLSTPVSTPGLE